MTDSSSNIDIPLYDDALVLQHRGVRNPVDPYQPYAYLIEPEYGANGTVEDVATLFLTNKECPFRCVMCDLWKNTTEERVPDGAIVSQIEMALSELPYAPHVKLYNSGNFFDEKAIPRVDRMRIPGLVEDRETVIVECHPKLIDSRCYDFAKSIKPDLQIAMGLETVDPNVWPRLNKRMTLDDYKRATHDLVDHDLSVRSFILLRTPFQSEASGIEWAMRSIDFAFQHGVECCAVVPTRGGNGLMEEFARTGDYSPPSLRSMEKVLEYGLSLSRGRVFMDLWDIEKFYDCPRCSSLRAKRIKTMNTTQSIAPAIQCGCET